MSAGHGGDIEKVDLPVGLYADKPHHPRLRPAVQGVPNGYNTWRRR